MLLGEVDYGVLGGIGIPDGKGQVVGLSGPLKSMVISAAVYAAKELIQSSTTARQRDCFSWLQCSMLLTGRCHNTLFPLKIHPMQSFVNILWPLIIIIIIIKSTD